jgi:YVTN family beta-propeller protein
LPSIRWGGGWWGRCICAIGRRVWHLAISADGTRAYAANGLSDNVSVIDLAGAKVVGTAPVGAGPWGIVAVP